MPHGVLNLNEIYLFIVKFCYNNQKLNLQIWWEPTTATLLTCLRMRLWTGWSARRSCLPVIHSGIVFCLTTLNCQYQSKCKGHFLVWVCKHCFRTDWKTFEQSIEELQKRFLISNLKTGNFVSLLRVILLRHSELKNSVLTENSLFIWQVVWLRVWYIVLNLTFCLDLQCFVYCEDCS